MSNPAIAARMGELIANESVQKALAVAKEEAPRALAEQIAIAQIPSPTFEETRRAEEIARLLREYGLTDVVIDPSGNVVGRRPGRGTEGGGQRHQGPPGGDLLRRPLPRGRPLRQGWGPGEKGQHRVHHRGHEDDERGARPL